MSKLFLKKKFVILFSEKKKKLKIITIDIIVS